MHDIQDINKVLENNDFDEQFWSAKKVEPKIFTPEDTLNRLINERTGQEVQLPPQLIENSDLYVSELVNQSKELPLVPENYFDKDKIQEKTKEILNSMVDTFDSNVNQNEIDDLKELLQKSKKYQDAMNSI